MVRHIVNDEEIRGIPIRNYMIFYTTYKDKNIVDILHIVHGSQNYQKYFEIEDNY
jgi:plasmid stabilization system protein ParE